MVVVVVLMRLAGGEVGGDVMLVCWWSVVGVGVIVWGWWWLVLEGGSGGGIGLGFGSGVAVGVGVCLVSCGQRGCGQWWTRRVEWDHSLGEVIGQLLPDFYPCRPEAIQVPAKNRTNFLDQMVWAWESGAVLKNSCLAPFSLWLDFSSTVAKLVSARPRRLTTPYM
ncbi:hypothetical protein B0T18DRAFT_139259 [Schizothecium vesticola]|uniref:Uncharacterized protein n=1 Tax=Schizothecium vesticola TaxID=314040 RepID=A0AA40EUR8_9PEZI|nr:hypothetical protein B0T18DRAFT_139259 [Schizothecium vesticola]